MKVVFSHEFSGDRKNELLEAMGWENWTPILKPVEYKYGICSKACFGTERMNDDEPVFCLKMKISELRGSKVVNLRMKVISRFSGSEFITSQKTGRGGATGREICHVVFFRDRHSDDVFLSIRRGGKGIKDIRKNGTSLKNGKWD